MSTTHRAPRRALFAAGLATAALLFGATPAWAHVHVHADDAAPGSTSILTFQVPNESETGALTTQLSVALPNVASAATEAMPGWTVKLDRDGAAGTVRSATWTAAPGVGIAPDQFGLFRISVKLPDEKSVTLPATQTYSDGMVVKWDEPALPNGGEPEHPAPVLTLTGEAPAAHDMAPAPAATATAAPAAAPPAPSTSDDTARWLAGAALILAAVGVVAAFVRARRA
ncbi:MULTISPECIES: YcnI family protein [unclassified Mycobacterium]|uniref:YcnI family copper-binding membrane protein n=1 Tax=unclassified Mycobacterium TaxID=2642494 RepID=UPI0029C97139|nr:MULTISPECIES: YcnI family protein [unclassified Mycobacterium]